MLFRKEFLEGIHAGAISLAFRRWQRPTVRAGGTLLTPVGQLGIKAVERTDLDQITAADARKAGYASKEKLLAELRQRTEGDIFRIELGPLAPDPRIALRAGGRITAAEFEALRSRLLRWDAHAPEGEWTVRTLESLESHPGVRAGDLCGFVGQEKERFKLNVRKLKNLGLTESLGTGYRLSPRGQALLRLLRSASGGNAS